MKQQDSIFRENMGFEIFVDFSVDQSFKISNFAYFVQTVFVESFDVRFV